MLFVCMCMDVYLGGVCEIVRACCLYVYGCVSWGCVCDFVGMLSVCVWLCILGVCVRLCGHVVFMCMDVYLGGGVCVYGTPLIPFAPVGTQGIIMGSLV